MIISSYKADRFIERDNLIVRKMRMYGRRVYIETQKPFLFACLLGFVMLFHGTTSQAQENSQRLVLNSGTSLSALGSYGGELRVDSLAPGCLGYVGLSPDFIVEIAVDGWTQIDVEAVGEGEDTTLTVKGTSDYFCNDDIDENNLNPGVTSYLTAGEYYIYVGAHNARQEGEYRIDLTHGNTSVVIDLVSNVAHHFYGESGGELDASQFQENCVGAVNASPNLSIRLKTPSHLDVQATSSSDLTLLITGHDQVLCHDDSLLTLDPHIADDFPAGIIRIYVGSHNDAIAAPYHLTVLSTELE